ncbi:hypothetical protein [Candidatus Viadribacter manganicus]|uniref:hypothetical protein n=1 Tax=Candidatus Viadribacter manganicus TaxID=1759059 RepID=UPI003AAD83C8
MLSFYPFSRRAHDLGWSGFRVIAGLCVVYLCSVAVSFWPSIDGAWPDIALAIVLTLLLLWLLFAPGQTDANRFAGPPRNEWLP